MAEIYQALAGFGGHQGRVCFDAEFSAARLGASVAGVSGIDEGIIEEMEGDQGGFGNQRASDSAEGSAHPQSSGTQRFQGGV